jgi:hypothetical protein
MRFFLVENTYSCSGELDTLATADTPWSLCIHGGVIRSKSPRNSVKEGLGGPRQTLHCYAYGHCSGYESEKLLFGLQPDRSGKSVDSVYPRKGYSVAPAFLPIPHALTVQRVKGGLRQVAKGYAAMQLHREMKLLKSGKRDYLSLCVKRRPA